MYERAKYYAEALERAEDYNRNLNMELKMEDENIQAKISDMKKRWRETDENVKRMMTNMAKRVSSLCEKWELKENKKKEKEKTKSKSSRGRLQNISTVGKKENLNRKKIDIKVVANKEEIEKPLFDALHSLENAVLIPEATEKDRKDMKKLAGEINKIIAKIKENKNQDKKRKEEESQTIKNTPLNNGEITGAGEVLSPPTVCDSLVTACSLPTVKSVPSKTKQPSNQPLPAPLNNGEITATAEELPDAVVCDSIATSIILPASKPEKAAPASSSTPAPSVSNVQAPKALNSGPTSSPSPAPTLKSTQSATQKSTSTKISTKKK